MVSGGESRHSSALELAAAAEEEEEEEFISGDNWKGKHNSLSRGAGADQP
jgi:hypothetical protein